MNNTVKQGHTRQHQQHKLGHCHQGIDGIQEPCGIAHLGHHLAEGGARAFRLGQDGAASAHLGHDSQGEDQHAHAANPVHERAPEQHAAADDFHIPQDGGAGGGEARYCFKKGIPVIGCGARKHKGQRTKSAQQHPGEPYGDKALPGTQRFIFGL